VAYTYVPDEKPEPEPYFSYYKTGRLAEDKVIYVLNNDGAGGGAASGYSNDQMFTAQAIQGLFNRVSISFYLNGEAVTNSINTDLAHLDYAADKWGLETENISLNAAVTMYKDAWAANAASRVWGSVIPLTDLNNVAGRPAYVEAAPQEGYESPGYILYTKGNLSVNVAATIAGVTGFLPIESGQENWAIEQGLKKKIDVTNTNIHGNGWVFNVFRGELSKDMLINQSYVQSTNTNPFLKDYGICYKYVFTYYNNNTDAPQSYRNSLHGWLNKNIPVLGYPENEVSDVRMFAGYGQFIVPTDYSYNLSFFSAKEFRLNPGADTDAADEDLDWLTFSPNEAETAPAEEGKHYVAFIFSDGDNASMWQNSAPYAANMMNASARENDDFVMTWGLTPSLSDLLPTVYDEVLSKATANDSFMAPVSGQGYVNPYQLKTSHGESYGNYVNRLSTYLKRSGQSIVTVMSDGADTTQRIGTYEDFAQVPELKGGLIYQGGSYFSGVNGGVYWADGKDAKGNAVKKPFIGPRDSLWSTTPAYIAARIMMYPKDIHSINGYTIVNVHPWSHNYQDVRAICEMIGRSDPDVEVVSMERLYDMVIANVTPPAEKQTGYLTPAQNGSSITAAHLRENPELIPVNPLKNEFLLWEEDWSGVSGVSFAGSDNMVTGEHGSWFSGSVRITAGNMARKEAYVLPNEDDLHIWFTARADSSAANETSKMEVKLTVDGVTKTVISGAVLKSGARAANEKTDAWGDGWGFYAFPVSQYFPDYKNKTAGVEITCVEGAALKIDNFNTEMIRVTPNSGYDVYDNQFRTGNTEDWALGCQWLTSQYAYWSAYDSISGAPNNQINIDVSNGGGYLKRVPNSNLFQIKTYTLPELGEINRAGGLALTYQYTAAAATSTTSNGMGKLSVLIDGKYFILRDWAAGGGTVTAASLSEITGMTTEALAGKTMTVIFEARDSGRVAQDGAGELVRFNQFVTLYQ
jgi:hypothetical protein